MTHLIAVLALAVPQLDHHGDPLPPGAVLRLGTVRFRVGSDRIIYSHALSPDGKYLAAEDRDGIGLWDTETGRLARRLPWRTWQGTNPQFGLAFSPDGKRLARLAGRVVAVWDLTTGRELFDIDFKEEGEFRGIAFVSGRDQLFVTGWRKPRALTLDARTGRVVRTTDLTWPGKYPDLIPVGPVVVGRLDRTWMLYEPETGLERARFSTASEADEALTVTPDGKRVWVVSFTGRLRSVDAETGKVIEDLDPPAGWKTGRSRLAVSPGRRCGLPGRRQPDRLSARRQGPQVAAADPGRGGRTAVPPSGRQAAPGPGDGRGSAAVRPGDPGGTAGY
jgi:WD40 repeat protein